MIHEALKRGFDILGAGMGMAVLWPLCFVIGLLIKLSDGGPVFFRQVRVGRFGKPFHILKFRTMVIGAEAKGPLVTNGMDARITRVGHLLRRTKLDELPQLWNVLVGEMSLVGPRPEVPCYVERYTIQQREILRYKPGITDVASVLFRNEESLLRSAQDVEQFYLTHCLEKKIELNRQYAEHASVLQDARIILQTVFPYWLGVSVIYGIGLAVNLWLSYQLRYDFQMTPLEYAGFWQCLPAVVLSQLAALGGCGQLRASMSYFSIPELSRCAAALAMALVFVLGLWSFSNGGFAPSPSVALIDCFLSLSVLCAIRMTARHLRERSTTNAIPWGARPQRVAIIGANDAATQMALDFAANRNCARRVVAFFDDNPHRWHKRPHNIPIVGMPECLLNPEWQNRIDEVVVALPETNPVRLQEIVALLKRLSLKVTFAAT